jgi:hypothetical protein
VTQNSDLQILICKTPFSKVNKKGISMGFNCFANQETPKKFQLSKGFCQLCMYTITQIAWLVNNGLVIREILQNIKPLTKKLVAQIQMCVQTILKCIFHEGDNVECPLIFGKPKNPYCSNIGQFNVFCCLWLRIANTNTLLKSL